MTETHTGHCLCGGVSYRVTGPLRPVVGCHCGQCRRQTGLYLAATETQKEHFELLQSASLKWYRSSDFAQRGFCSECGSVLFWKADDGGSISIAAGSLDEPSGVKFSHHIFVQDKASFYEITDGLPQYAVDD